MKLAVATLLIAISSACSYQVRYRVPASSAGCAAECRGRGRSAYFACLAECPAVEVKERAPCPRRRGGTRCATEERTSVTAVMVGLGAALTLGWLVYAAAQEPFELCGSGCH